MAQRKLRLNDDQMAFARTLFQLYPKFIPTQSLYVDLEGSGGGAESIINYYWPQNSRSGRFAWNVRKNGRPISVDEVNDALVGLGLHSPQPNWVVTYAQGRYDSEERDRIIDALGRDPWPKAKWVNLLHAFQESPEMTRAIREHRHVKFKRDQTRIRRSLESLEWEFGIKRAPSIRSHNNEYSDGLEGKMTVLKLTKKYIDGTASSMEEKNLRRYCLQDVKSMHQISRFCERGLFGPRARGRRYAKPDATTKPSRPARLSAVEIKKTTVVPRECPTCGETFKTENKNGNLFSDKQRAAQLAAHIRNFH